MKFSGRTKTKKKKEDILNKNNIKNKYFLLSNLYKKNFNKTKIILDKKIYEEQKIKENKIITVINKLF